MALLGRKSKKEDSGGSAQQSAPQQPPQPQEAPLVGSSGDVPLSSGLERKWEEAWRRARGGR